MANNENIKKKTPIKRFRLLNTSEFKPGQSDNQTGSSKGAGKKAIVAAAPGPVQVIPADIVDLLGKPSLLETEVAAEYDALLFLLAEAVKPKDAIEWIWIADVANLVWEMRRLRGMRDKIVESENAEWLGDLAKDNLSFDYNWDELKKLRDRLVSHWKSGNPFRRQIVRRFLTRKGVDLRQIHSFGFGRSFDRFTKLEGMISDLGRCRDSVLREIERRRDTVARRLRDVTDAEFEITRSGTQSVGN